jgi:uncharacterized protein involved in type VI secretion and phage assembly
MEGGLVESAARIDEPDDRRIYGLTVAEVVENCDKQHAGRVKVRFSWLPGFEPWARLALVDRGMFFIPQVGDEVLVNLNRGDVSEVYVVGCLWNGKDQPPAKEEDDPKNKRIIKTPSEQSVTFDDKAGSIVIKSKDNHKIEISPSQIKITMAEDKASVTLSSSGGISIDSTSSITLKADTIKIEGTSEVKIGKTTSTTTIAGKQILIG